MADKDRPAPPWGSGSPTNYYWDFERTDPLPVEGGVKAKSQRGRFAKTWWANRWERALTQWVNPARLARAKVYARRGQVIDLDIQVGLIIISNQRFYLVSFCEVSHLPLELS